MDDDILKALIAALMADATITAVVADRIYPSAQVTPSDPFPRGYVGQIKSPFRDAWMEGGQYRIRFPMFTVTWATTSTISVTAQQDVEHLDARADTLLRSLDLSGIANIIYLQRHDTIPATPQTNDNVEFITCGGIWIARREYEYYS